MRPTVQMIARTGRRGHQKGVALLACGQFTQGIWTNKKSGAWEK